MLLTHYFVPTWSGDFRLLRTGTNACRLSVEDPTAAELPVLARLVTAAKANNWAEEDIEIAPTGVTEVDLKVSIEKAGPIVSGTVHGDASVWTAVRHESGKMTVVSEGALDAGEKGALADDALDAADLVETVNIDVSDVRLRAACTRCGSVIGKPCVTLGANPRVRAPHKARKLATGTLAAVIPTNADAPVAAAAVRKPRQGCPAPTAARRRASEVLSVFSTASQYDQFRREGVMRLVGNRTGRSYWLFHRDEAAKRRLTHSLLDSSGTAICVWDERVPAEEEALAIKLAVEHREGWLLRAPRGPAKNSKFMDGRRVDGRRLETWAGGQQVRAVIGPSPYGVEEGFQ